MVPKLLLLFYSVRCDRQQRTANNAHEMIMWTIFFFFSRSFVRSVRLRDCVSVVWLGSCALVKNVIENNVCVCVYDTNADECVMFWERIDAQFLYTKWRICAYIDECRTTLSPTVARSLTVSVPFCIWAPHLMMIHECERFLLEPKKKIKCFDQIVKCNCTEKRLPWNGFVVKPYNR